MAEEESDLDSERLKEELESLLDNGGKGGNGLQSKLYCTRFCQVVEEHTGRCQVPLPQLQVLRTALCCFTQGIATFPADCEHVQYTLSSLALSFFELLLFFGKDEFLEDPLKDILDSFQECHSCLLGHGNMYLMLVKQIVKEGGPWENPVLQAILKEMPQHQEEVDRYLSSEVPAFFEFRVRYLLACERIQEAVALSKCCIQHSEVGRHLYFHQAYLTCLLKASLYDHLQKEMAMIDGKDAVEIICNTENEEKDDLLLVLCKAFLTQQLQNGDMYYIWDLIFIWSKLQLRANPSKQDFLEECHQLMSTATNVKMIFPFMKIIKAELGDEGLQFCVELCACALQMDLRHDPVTKSLVYKMIAYLLPNDLEVCRACALLVFFMERTVDSYKIVYLLYTYPDQEYHMDSSVIKNHIRFELLQILKRGLFFDPEFWNLITLKTNCLSLMSEKVMKAALNETVEDDKWIQNDSIKETYKMHSEIPDKHTSRLMNYSDKDRRKPAPKRCIRQSEAASESAIRRRGRKPGKRVKVIDTSALRRSLRQLDMIQENSMKQLSKRQQRHLGRQAEKKTLKRRGRKPSWFLPETNRQAENSAPRHVGRPRKKPPQSPLEVALPKLAASETGQGESQQVSQEQPAADEVTPLSPLPETVPIEETPQSPERASPMQVSYQSLDSLGTPLLDTMLEVSFPDNEAMEIPVEKLEVVEQPQELIEQTDVAPEDSINHLDTCAEEPSGGLSEREPEPPVKQEDNTTVEEPVLPQEPIAEACEFQQSSNIEVDDATLQQQDNGTDGQMDIKDEEENTIQSPVKAPEENAELPTVMQDNIPECTVLEQGLPDVLPEGPVVARDKSPQGLVIELDTVLEAHVAELVCTPEALVAEPEVLTHGLDSFVEETNRAPVEASEPDDTVKQAASPPKLEQEQHTVSPPGNDPDFKNSPKTVLGNTLSRNENCVPRHRCMLCNKDFMGGHIKRHALVHLQKGNLRCVLCGKTYKQRNFMLNHLKEHLQKMKSKKRLPDTQSNENCTPVENGTSETCERDVISLPPDLKHSAAEVENHVENHNRINVNLEHVSSESQGLLKSDKNEIACAAKDQSMVQRANGSISKQKSECQKEQFRCPAEGCARSFVRQWVLVKHVKKAHPNDMKVQECTFLWTKGKCQYCQRKFLCLQHYSDHLKRHDGAHRYFCQHYSCNERFKTQAELGQHLKTHSQFQAQCSFPECFELFSDLSLLHEHECWHYSLMTNLDGTPSAAASGHNSTEASGILVKRKRKKDAQEAPIQDLKVRKESAQPKTYIPSGGGKSILNSVEVKVATPEAKSLEQPEDGAREDSAGGRVSDGQLLNGHADGDKPASAQLPEGAAQALDLQDHAPEAGKKDTGPTEIKLEGVAGKDPEKAPPPQDVSTAALKKPRRYDDEVYSYGGTSKKPFIRPPPSAYLAEQYISMPKRRKSPTKAESPSSAPQSEQAGGVQRHRCTKCFALFDKAEELQSHLAQKKCQAFFGFDSDEESA
ncbi:zinc finger protein 654 [Lepisosteus oculatus]|uniref:zinc finger protein 654 n=1 Tax=Lepisosteus oculatus TaxID=7918 RepID=UPI0035F51D2B